MKDVVQDHGGADWDCNDESTRKSASMGFGLAVGHLEELGGDASGKTSELTQTKLAKRELRARDAASRALISVAFLGQTAHSVQCDVLAERKKEKKLATRSAVTVSMQNSRGVEARPNDSSL